MSPFWDHSHHTVPARSPHKKGVLLLLSLSLFGLTAGAVYWRGYTSWVPANPNPRYTATAYIVQHADGASRVPFSHTDATVAGAAKVANTLAERYVDDQRQQWRRRMEGSCFDTRQAAEAAHGAYAEASAQLEACRQRLDEVTQASATQSQPQSDPAMVDNPQWLDLQTQLGALQRRRDELLVDRTPLHPSVQEAATEMARVHEQMADVPRRIPASQAKGTSQEMERNDRIQDTAAPTVQDQERLNELTAAVEQARRQCDVADLAEKLALQAQQSGPTFTIETARLIENPPQPDFGWRRLMATTLASGLLMAFGFAAFTVGTGIEPPVASAAELDADFDMPLLGTVPADSPIANAGAVSRRQSRRGILLITLGLLLMSTCPLVAIWGVTGM